MDRIQFKKPSGGKKMHCVGPLPHVVADIPDTENLKYVGGDMFQSIPSADAIFIKVTRI